MQNKRRSLLRKIITAVAGIAAAPAVVHAAKSNAHGIINTPTELLENGEADNQEIPLFSGHTKFGGMVFIAGKGAHFKGDIKSHTDHVLKELEKELIKAGSSMDKVVKVNVYLDDIKDYKEMNDVFRGRFGKNPPVRTTVAVAKGGVPGDSLVEMDCIAIQ
ncbi:RidA family protein [Pollutibacter soli]|uniref:RidA family protein n=1 Tax=Pollutibacter soli TaxID=3034157 RepID=UPI003013D16C